MSGNRDEGALLWFDDDIKRPLQQKILDGVERFRERMGYEPTEVHLNPAQAKALATARNGGLVGWLGPREPRQWGAARGFCTTDERYVRPATTRPYAGEKVAETRARDCEQYNSV